MVYRSKITEAHKMTELETMQVRLNKAVANDFGRVAVVLEGRDTAGKSGTIREVTHYLSSPDELETYTILTKNNNFYAGGVLVHSEINES